MSQIAGKIACANVLSDLYAMGVTECENMLMLLAVSTKMTEKERDVVVPLMMRGFKVGATALIFYLILSLFISSSSYILGLRSGGWIDRHRWPDSHEPLVHHWWCCHHCLPAQ